MHIDRPPLNLIIKSIPHLSGEVKHMCAAELGMAAAEAVADEIMTAPKPGLVDPLGSGCHRDMDWRTFIQSAKAIAPFWEKQALTGLNGTEPECALSVLRATGVEMEHAMFAATEGINTHKGLIYLMSLLIYGAGLSVYKRMPMTPDIIVGFASSAVNGTIERELIPLKFRTDISGMTNGEKLFVFYGVTGIRGEAEAGFPSVLRAGLPALRSATALGASVNDASISALLAIMEVNEDSNVIHRGGFDFWRREYRSMVSIAREKFDPLSGSYAVIEALEKSFMPRRISPGGAADLLSCTLFLNKVTSSSCQQ